MIFFFFFFFAILSEPIFGYIYTFLILFWAIYSFCFFSCTITNFSFYQSHIITWYFIFHLFAIYLLYTLPFMPLNPCAALSHSVMSDCLAYPWTVAQQAPRSMGIFQEEYWSRLPCPSPEDLPNPGIEMCDWTHFRHIVYRLSHQGSPRILEWVIDPFSREISRPRNWTRISCITGGFFTSWATWEAPLNPYT